MVVADYLLAVRVKNLSLNSLVIVDYYDSGLVVKKSVIFIDLKGIGKMEGRRGERGR